MSDGDINLQERQWYRLRRLQRSALFALHRVGDLFGDRAMDEVFDASGAAPTMHPTGLTGRDCLKVIRAAHRRLGTEPTQAELRGKSVDGKMVAKGFNLNGKPTSWRDDWRHCPCRDCTARRKKP